MWRLVNTRHYEIIFGKDRTARSRLNVKHFGFFELKIAKDIIKQFKLLELISSSKNQKLLQSEYKTSEKFRFHLLSIVIDRRLLSVSQFIKMLISLPWWWSPYVLSRRSDKNSPRYGKTAFEKPSR